MKYEQLMPNDKQVEALWHPGETKRPYGYFAAQTAFAMKALELGLADSAVQSLEEFTAIPRKIMGNKNPVKAQGSHWVDTAEVLQTAPQAKDFRSLADTLFARYLAYPEVSVYRKPPLESLDGKQAGAFTHEYDSSARAIRLHFMERVREAKSEFGQGDMLGRWNDMKAMTQLILRKEYEPVPNLVTSGSWMYNYRSIINVMPESFRESAAPPPHLSFGGDSLWGQFVTSDGGYHGERYQEFLTKLKEADDLSSMVDAFPMQVLFLQAPVKDFYEYYSVEQ